MRIVKGPCLIYLGPNPSTQRESVGRAYKNKRVLDNSYIIAY